MGKSLFSRLGLKVIHMAAREDSANGGTPAMAAVGLDLRGHLLWKWAGVVSVLLLVFKVQFNLVLLSNRLALTLLAVWVLYVALYTPFIIWTTRAGLGRHWRMVQAIILHVSFFLDTGLVTYLTVASGALRGHIPLAYVPFVLSLISLAPRQGTFGVGLAATLLGYVSAGWYTEDGIKVFRDDMFWVHGVFIVLFVTSSHLFHATAHERKDLQRANELLSKLSFKDALTGLFNRRYFDQRLEEEVNRAERLNKPVALLMVDIDFFKTYNDTYGHERGDGILRLVAEVMRANSRLHDVVCRYGGEEFAVILPETDRAQALCAAERTRQAIERLDIPLGPDAPRKVTISIGVGVFPEDAVTASELVQHADHALYEAKHSGRNTVATCKTAAQQQPGCANMENILS